MTPKAWRILNRQRGLLIGKKLTGAISERERSRLNVLNRMAEHWSGLAEPRQAAALAREKRLIAEGVIG